MGKSMNDRGTALLLYRFEEDAPKRKDEVIFDG
jgi:hypothetical protein